MKNERFNVVLFDKNKTFRKFVLSLENYSRQESPFHVQHHDDQSFKWRLLVALYHKHAFQKHNDWETQFQRLTDEFYIFNFFYITLATLLHVK